MEIKTFSIKTLKRNEKSRLLYNAFAKSLVIQEFATLGRSLLEGDRNVYNGQPHIKVEKVKWDASFDDGKSWNTFEETKIFVDDKEIISGDLLNMNRDKNTGVLEVELVTSWN